MKEVDENKVKVYVIPDEISGHDEYYSARNEKELKELFAKTSGFEADGPELDELEFHELDIKESFMTNHGSHSVYQIVGDGEIGFIGYVK